MSATSPAWAPPPNPNAALAPVAPMSVTLSLMQPLAAPAAEGSGAGTVVVAGLVVATGLAAAVALILRLRRGAR